MGPFELAVMETFEGQSSRLSSSRICAIVEQLTSEDAKLYDDVAKAWLEFKPKLSDPNIPAWRVWADSDVLREAASLLAHHVEKTRSAPKGVRGVRSMLKLFNRYPQRYPKRKGIAAWFEEAKPALLMLLKSKDWPTVGAGIEIDDFVIINVSRHKDTSNIERIVKEASRRIKQSKVPRAREILYGDVVMTNELRTRRVAAIYRYRDDDIWIRPKTKFGEANVNVFVHELGHRYWSQYLNPTKKKEWEAWDRELRTLARSSISDIPLPDVGDKLPLTVKGMGDEPPVITQIKPGRMGELKYYFSDTAYVPGSMIRDYYDTLAKDSMFPSEYARTTNDPEEHFCESFRMYLAGELEDVHLEKFESIIL